MAMATDDKHPDSKESGSENPPAGTDPDTGFPVDSGSGRDGFSFVDRDDSDGSGFVDLDYDEAFPGPKISSGDESPDPGYAAFADELDDPLADWPSPESRLEELPEMRGAETPAFDSPSGEEDDGTSAAEPSVEFDESEPDDEPTTTPDWEDREFPEAEFFSDPPENDDAEPEAHHAPVGVSSVEKAASSVIDRDVPGENLEPVAAWDEDDTPAPADPPISVDDGSYRTTDIDDESDDVPIEDFEAALPEPEAEPLSDDIAEFDSEPELEPEPELDSDTEELLVDDFLNDLDDIDEESDAMTEPDYAGGESYMDDEDDEDHRYAESVAESVFASQQGSVAAQDPETTPHAATADLREAPGDATKESGGRPWMMIAVVAVALTLLAAGGYGVVQQRSNMQAEIRELQAQLATAMAPDEALEERERQRQMALQNESLGTEIAALEAENRALGEQIANLENELEARQAAVESARAAAAAALAEAERTAATRQSSAPRGTASPAPAAVAGTWFVNFGSYAQRNVADRWAARISVNQGRVNVQEAQAGGRTLYRVRVVGLDSRDAAERVATALEREYQLPKLWVGKS
ncbi:MAG: SPOR domain-containing protein [Pseudomonadota bacterium]